MKCFSTLVVLLVLVIVLGCEGAQTTTAAKAKFDSKAWIAAKGDRARQPMVKLLENELEVGMSVEDVVNLIGEPDAKIESESGKCYIYGLGPGLIDYEEFRVIFDESWTVAKFMQLQG